MKSQASLLIDTKLILGEGPIWHPKEQKLFCVDIRGNALCQIDPEIKSVVKYQVGEQIGAALPTDDGRFLLALQSGLYYFSPDDGTKLLAADLERDLPDNRCNDAKCDAKGRLWVGTMDNLEKDTTGGLYSFSGAGLQRHLENIGISNGIAWTSDYRTMYYIDTPTQEVVAYDYDLEGGKISAGRTVIKIDPSLGHPDGMTIDKEGKLWIAHWGGSGVYRWDPETGQLLTSIEVAAPHTTSCCFGGPDFDTLFITTARKGLTAKQLEQAPLSGGIFTAQPEVSGRADHFFQVPSV